MKELIILLILCWISQTESGYSMCPPNHYYRLSEKDCVECSACPINQIIRRPCTEHRNTQCGPFFEFDKFHQAPKSDLDLLDLEPTKHHRQHKGSDKTTDSEKLRGIGVRPDHKQRKDSTPEVNSDLQSTAPGLAKVSSGEARWKTLALALIGVLCVVSVFLVVFIFVACYIKQRRSTVDKEVIYDPEFPGANDTYVQVCSARDRLKPPCRTLRELRQTEYDSGSDDNCVPPVAPSSRLLGHPGVRSEDYDADHSGQTISTIKSSDYVYFNSPHNANGEP